MISCPRPFLRNLGQDKASQFCNQVYCKTLKSCSYQKTLISQIVNGLALEDKKNLPQVCYQV